MQINNQFSSIRGKIGVLMAAVTHIDGADQYERILALLRALPGHAGLLVWCNSRDVMTSVRDWMAERGVTPECRLLNEPLPAQFRCLLVSPEDERALTFYSHWVRDPFVWKWDEPDNLILLGSEDAENEDSLWAHLHLRALNFEGRGGVNVQARAIPVAGGNILFDEDFVMVGAKQFRESAAGSDNADARSRLLAALNGNGQLFTRVIEIGAHTGMEPPKLIHIDLYLSLTGMRENDRYVVLVGRCEAVRDTPSPDPDLARSVEQMNAYLDAVASQLSAQQFSVRRNPVPVVQKRNALASYLCAYNNCLVEVAEDRPPVVWLAKLSHGQESAGYFEQIRRMENENISLWQDLGFEVRMVEADFHTILDDQGSLHCITNEVIRI